ncbi:hypothetical protein ACFL45_07410 [Candidatus Neomarinimicrobiota bacterium]
MERPNQEQASQLLSGIIEIILELRALAITAVRPLQDLRNKTSLITSSYAEWQQFLADALETMVPVLTDIAENILSLPEATRQTLVALEEHGWYFDPDTPLPQLWILASALEETDIRQVEAAFVKHYRDRALHMQQDLITLFPPRKMILEQAFQAHGQREYTLSVPVLLAQADGICHELIGLQLFCAGSPANSDDAHGRTAEPADDIVAALLHPFTTSLRLSTPDKLLRYPTASSRWHDILHGNLLDYGTEEESLKAISLLNNVSTILTWKTDV